MALQEELRESFHGWDPPWRRHKVNLSICPTSLGPPPSPDGRHDIFTSQITTVESSGIPAQQPESERRQFKQP